MMAGNDDDDDGRDYDYLKQVMVLVGKEELYAGRSKDGEDSFSLVPDGDPGFTACLSLLLVMPGFPAFSRSRTHCAEAGAITTTSE